jgi:hypothetical protein
MSTTRTRSAALAMPLGLLMVLASGGCESSADGPAMGPRDPGTLLLARGQPEKPLPFRTEFRFSGNLIDPGEPGSAPRCNELGLHTLVGSGDGMATHMGNVTGTFSNCTPFPIPGPVDFLAGEVTIIAANGDRLLFTYSGEQGPVDMETLTADYTALNEIVGGSGRFEGASGSLDAVGKVDFNPGGVSTEVADGWIRFDASQRRP